MAAQSSSLKPNAAQIGLPTNSQVSVLQWAHYTAESHKQFARGHLSTSSPIQLQHLLLPTSQPAVFTLMTSHS